MKNIFLILLLLCAPAFAGTVEVDGEIVTYDDELSFRDFTGWEFQSRPEYDFSGKTIYASVFSQETPDRDIFSQDMKGAIFVKCNLDNVYVSDENIVLQSSQRRFEEQNDLRDWEIDDKGDPVKVVSEDFWKAKGYSVDVKDIPPQKIGKIEDVPKADTNVTP